MAKRLRTFQFLRASVYEGKDRETMTNHWLDELASKHVDMPSPGVESRLLQEIARLQDVIKKQMATITYAHACAATALEHAENAGLVERSLNAILAECDFALEVKREDTK